MSDLPLPQDVGRWPSDPFELLKLPQPVNKSDARRAYTRLIRVYKPDHYPEEFRRIRDAYDQVLQLVEMFGWEDAASQAEPAAEDSANVSLPSVSPWRRVPLDMPPPPRPEKHTPTVHEPAPPLRSLGEELADAWQLAADGAPELAQRRFFDLRPQHADHADLCLRLFWLWKLFPNLVPPGQSCRDWLARGLNGTRLAGPLGMLFLREVARDANEALSPRCRELMLASHDSSWVAGLAEVRWKTASAAERWSVIDEDLGLLRARLERTDGLLWMRLLFCAVQEWVRPTTQFAKGRLRQLAGEIEALPEIGAWQRDELMRLDFFREFAEEWCDQGRTLFMQAGLGQAISTAWDRAPWQFGPALLAYLAELVKSPRQQLDGLDFLQRNAPLTLAQFGNVLHAYRRWRDIDDESWPAEPLGELLSDFLDSFNWADLYYSKARVLIHEFCLREVVPPERIALFLQEHGARILAGNGNLLVSLAADYTLHFACLAHRVFVAA